MYASLLGAVLTGIGIALLPELGRAGRGWILLGVLDAALVAIRVVELIADVQ